MSSSFSSERGSWRPKTQLAPNILDESDGEDTDEIVTNSRERGVLSSIYKVLCEDCTNFKF